MEVLFHNVRYKQVLVIDCSLCEVTSPNPAGSVLGVRCIAVVGRCPDPVVDGTFQVR